MTSYTRMVTATMINEARFGFLHNNYFRTPQNSDLDPSTFVPGLTSPLEGLGGLPEVRMNGFRGFIDLAGSGDRQRKWELYDNLSWNRGSHSLKLGVEWQRASSLKRANLGPARGQLLFDGRYTGNSFADFLLGYPYQTTRPTSNTQVEPQNTRWAGFVQDDWVVSPRLTLNLGVRYEYYGLFENSFGDLANFDPSLGKLVLISGTANPSFASLPIVRGEDVGITPETTCTRIATTSLRASGLRGGRSEGRLSLCAAGMASSTTFRQAISSAELCRRILRSVRHRSSMLCPGTHPR